MAQITNPKPSPKIPDVPRGPRLFQRAAVARIINLRTGLQFEVQNNTKQKPDGTYEDGLRMKFTLEKSDTSTTNKGQLQIFNLSEQTRNRFNIPPEIKGQPPKKGLLVELSAGYRDLIRIVSTGNASSSSQFISPDWVTTFDIVDGGTALRTGRIFRSYQANFPIQQIITDVVNEFGLPTGYISPVITDARTRFGMTLNGGLRQIMDEFAIDYKFKWSVQNNTFNLWDPKTGAAGAAVNLTPASGLLGSPIKTNKGIKLECLIIPTIVPGCTVRISGCRDFNGDVIVKRQKISGDTEGNDWSMKCTGDLKK